jgi:Tetratricopeptide repeat
MNDLALTLRDQGNLDEAAAMSRKTLKKMQRILGDEHPTTITAMNNIALILRDQGKLDEAAAMNKDEP